MAYVAYVLKGRVIRNSSHPSHVGFSGNIKRIEVSLQCDFSSVNFQLQSQAANVVPHPAKIPFTRLIGIYAERVGC
jgi:hypothetical protein